MPRKLYLGVLLTVLACSQQIPLVETPEEEDAGGTGAVTPDAGASVVNDAGTPARDSSVVVPPDSSAPIDAGQDVVTTPPPKGPCGDVTEDGRCASPSRVETCIAVPTGQSKEALITQFCPAYEECKVVSGRARCTPIAGRCEPEASECVGTTQRRVCNANGEWVTRPCASCTASHGGTTCPGTVATTITHTHSLVYEARSPNSALNDWGALESYYAIGALITSYSWSDETQSYTPIDSQVVTDAGDFSIKVASPHHPRDAIIVWATQTDPSGRVAFSVAEPDVPNGLWSFDRNGIPAATANTSTWGWARLIDELGTNGSTVTITEDEGSGALMTFDLLRYTFNSTRSLMTTAAKSVIVWMRPNTLWDCGACFLDVPTSLGADVFETQIFLSMTALDQGYWSDAVTNHELGHWAMASFGTIPREAGRHSFCPTYPGQAYQEGWATAYSSIARETPLYFDKQDGTFFWVDLATKQSSFQEPWNEPTASGGLLQQMDEHAVSAIVWSMHTEGGFASNAPLLTALESRRLNQSPFGRGYTRHYWDGACEPRTNVIDTGVSIPILPDYLDALVCSGFSTAKVSAAIGSYPYPVASPICQ